MNYKELSAKKAELDRHRRAGGGLSPVLVRSLEDWFRVELTYSSNAIEGNTLTRRETALVVEKGLTVGGKSLVEHLEATNHAAALDWVTEIAGRSGGVVSEKEILTIHGMILHGIDDANAGRYRDVAVRISGSQVVLPNPVKVPELMAEFGRWLGKPGSLHPVELAAEAHYRLVTIHPFADGNGRTARLLMNLILLMHGYPPALIPIRSRLKYIGALEQAQLGGSKDDYLKLIGRAAGRSLGIYLKAIGGDAEAVPVEPEEELLKIGQLAEKAGETVATIRFWTKQGLLHVAETTAANYALYALEAVERTRRIQALKERRYTIKEIGKMLDAQ